MFITTKVTCPLCGEYAIISHTFKTKPTFGSCEACGYDHVTGYTGREQIEYRRPKLVPDWDYYA